MSSPTYVRSNEHAKAAVKVTLKLALKCISKDRLDEEVFESGLLELSNAPRVDCRSLAQILFGHPLWTRVPTHHRAFAAEMQRAAEECDTKADCIKWSVKQSTTDQCDLSRSCTLNPSRCAEQHHRIMGPRQRSGRHRQVAYISGKIRETSHILEKSTLPSPRNNHFRLSRKCCSGFHTYTSTGIGPFRSRK